MRYGMDILWWLTERRLLDTFQTIKMAAIDMHQTSKQAAPEVFVEEKDALKMLYFKSRV